jgi:hypothetical protein
MKFLLLLFFLVGGEGQSIAVAFPTKEACEIAGEKIQENVANANAEADKQGGEKASHFAFACAPIQVAPQGKQI